jgi:hypothetical protein
VLEVAVSRPQGLQAIAPRQFCRSQSCHQVHSCCTSGFRGGMFLHMQVHAMFEVYPDRFHAYTYPLGSIAAAWLSGLAIYGAAAWAHM